MPFLIELQDAARELKVSPIGKAALGIEEENAKDGLCKSSSGDRSLDRLFEGSPTTEGHECIFAFQVLSILLLLFIAHNLVHPEP